MADEVVNSAPVQSDEAVAPEVAAAVELEELLADCVADLGRQPLADAALLVSDFH